MILRFAWRLIAALAVVLVLWFGLQPEPAPNLVGNSDKWTHALAFAAVTLAMLGATPDWPRGFTAIVLLVVGVFIECWQAFLLPHRSFDPTDLLMNAIGVAFALLLFWVISSIASLFLANRPR